MGAEKPARSEIETRESKIGYLRAAQSHQLRLHLIAGWRDVISSPLIRQRPRRRSGQCRCPGEVGIVEGNFCVPDRKPNAVCEARSPGRDSPGRTFERHPAAEAAVVELEQVTDGQRPDSMSLLERRLCSGVLDSTVPVDRQTQRCSLAQQQGDSAMGVVGLNLLETSGVGRLRPNKRQEIVSPALREGAQFLKREAGHVLRRQAEDLRDLVSDDSRYIRPSRSASGPDMLIPAPE